MRWLRFKHPSTDPRVGVGGGSQPLSHYSPQDARVRKYSSPSELGLGLRRVEEGVRRGPALGGFYPGETDQKPRSRRPRHADCRRW